MLQAFHTEPDIPNEINISPFRKLGKSHRKVIMKGNHDTPVYLHPEINAKAVTG